MTYIQTRRNKQTESDKINPERERERDMQRKRQTDSDRQTDITDRQKKQTSRNKHAYK